MACGYDTDRFKSTFDEGFLCSICLCVLKDPVQCESNEHYFCSGCIKEHLEKTSHTCPVCQDKLTVETLRKAPRIVEDCVSRYKLTCDHAERGCTAIIEIGALQAHVRDCGFTPVSCSNKGCNDVVNKRDVDQHENELCHYKSTTCMECGKQMAHHKYRAHGCVLRRDFDEMKKELAEVKAAQNEMMSEMREGMKRMTATMEKLEKSYRKESCATVPMFCNFVVVAGRQPVTKKPLSTVERFNQFTQAWTPLPELKIARYGHAAVIFENQLLVCGGFITHTLDNTTDSIEVLDLNGNSSEWKPFPVNLPVKVAVHKCVVYENRLLIIGGSGGGNVILDTIYELLLVPPYSSKLLCHMKKGRSVHGVELFDDKVLIAGGRRTKTDVEIFDITRNQCIKMPPLSSPVYGMATVRRDESMLLIGGFNEEAEYDSGIIEYNLNTGKSKLLLVMASTRACCSAVLHGNTLVVIGGETGGANGVDCYSFLSNTWTQLLSLEEGRYDATAVVVNKVYSDG